MKWKEFSVIIPNVPEIWYKGINFNRRIEYKTIAVLQDTRHHHLFIINTAVRNSEMNKTAQRFYASFSKRRYFHLKHIFCEFFYNLLGFLFWSTAFNIQRASIESNSFEPIWKILLTLAICSRCVSIFIVCSRNQSFDFLPIHFCLVNASANAFEYSCGSLF